MDASIIDRLAIYRNLLTLRDGTRVLLRLLDRSDKNRLQAMFAVVGDEDLKSMRDDVKNPATIQRWIDGLDYSQVIPLLAVVNDDIVGDATLHLGRGPQRHTAELRIFLSKPYRQRGLGVAMLKAQIDLAKKLNLHLLTAQVIADRTFIIRAFRGLGFQLHTTLPDYFMMPDGETLDVALLILPLVRTVTEF
jgi:RimJ/RimL family protein N-acetyltransferase